MTDIDPDLLGQAGPHGDLMVLHFAASLLGAGGWTQTAIAVRDIADRLEAASAQVTP